MDEGAPLGTTGPACTVLVGADIDGEVTVGLLWLIATVGIGSINTPCGTEEGDAMTVGELVPEKGGACETVGLAAVCPAGDPTADVVGWVAGVATNGDAGPC
jgi:hypothetical protein